MLKTLLKKQLREMFRSYFYNQKTGKVSSKARTVGSFILFGFSMVVIMGLIFSLLIFALLETLMPLEMDWLYWVLIVGLGILWGSFGSVVSTFQSLYLAKDNDFLFSLPIPTKTIVSARLLSVFVIDVSYAGVLMVPAAVLYLIYANHYGRFSWASVFGSLGALLFVLAVVMVICCFLGYVIARFSVKLKGKSFAKVGVALLFIGAYYFFYFQAGTIWTNFQTALAERGDFLSAKLPVLRFLGSMGEGNLLSALLFLAAALVLLYLAVRFVSRTFLKTASQVGQSPSVAKLVKGDATLRSPFATCLNKEFKRFTSSANYMLNCGLGCVFIIALGIMLLLKGNSLSAGVEGYFLACLIPVAIMGTGGALNVIATPSVSLEGKSLWIYQTMPLSPKTYLRAKLSVQLLINGVAMLFTSVCAVIALKTDFVTSVLMILFPQTGNLLFSCLDLNLAFYRANFNWVNEVYPIKQDVNMLFAILCGLGISGVEIILAVFFGMLLGPYIFLPAVGIVNLVFAFLLYSRLMNKKAADFVYLS